MKIWQLSSITNGNLELIIRIASTAHAWKQYESLYSNYSYLVDVQDRVALDSIVSTDFVIVVLGEVRQNLYLSSDGWLRSRPSDSTDQALSMLYAFKKYGADTVEDVCEKGSAHV